jgi:hypothetical protein
MVLRPQRRLMLPPSSTFLLHSHLKVVPVLLRSRLLL